MSFDVESESFRSMKTGNLAQLELDGVANGIGTGVDVALANRAAVAETETSATKQVDRVDVAMRTSVRTRSGNSRSVAATMVTLLTFTEAARVLGISLRQFRRFVDGGESLS